MSNYGLVANGCLAHHFWHVRYLGTAILHSAKLFWQISNMPSILKNCAEFELIANSSWFWILMKIVFRWNYFLVILTVVKWPITKHMGLDGNFELWTRYGQSKGCRSESTWSLLRHVPPLRFKRRQRKQLQRAYLLFWLWHPLVVLNGGI